MCFNKQVSLITFVIGFIGSASLFIKGHRAESLFYFCVILMQFYEFLLWENPSCSKKNETLTKIAAITNHLEPVMFYLGLVLFGNKLPGIVHVSIVLYSLIALIYTKSVWRTLDCTQPDQDGHLYWKWNLGNNFFPFYTIFLCELLILASFGNIKYHVIVIFASFLVSLLLYGKEKVAGSMWCFIAAFVPWILSF